VDCPAQNGSHAWEDLVYVECLDPVSHEPVPDGGRGELVVTTVADRAAPLVRYRSGDLVRWTREPCACGTAHGRMWTIGRLADIVSIGALSVLPSDVWPIVESLPETSNALFQIVRSKCTSSSMWVRLGHENATPASRVAEIRDHLQSGLTEALGVRCDVELMSYDQLMSTRAAWKLPRVVND
jgi:phenylacetate-CoA ligase